mmetsp:Transcript_5589/g.7080  ORF Transcript_5589/g.7080 Transcript_5589/m.7080 type:complete len:87 (+) Transcript_5589:384-644(+)|eukprot:CAMPEP_0204832874 /NCGR_PEP_ID=MMETSP1346-20131115/15004_1 /ASSEMBLY_ACC=CAM_ASM_000771 /TAXON_ID=215587 /ORGANISM="Aplanochytrium stocchinoi, Strain GSBS06" /LENGTH=86 /DNA_ID=CAMNT_0051964977 /DNA_START=299 /DNA_END=559 /DNA_ORIENTATION=+
MASAPSEPIYPVQDRSPSFGKIIASFNFGDVATIGGITAVALPFGYYMGKPIPVPTMRAMGVIGFLGGFMLACQNSSSRLMGYSKP